MSFPFKHPSNILVVGPSQCGKTEFVKRVLFENMIQPPPTRIIYFYAEKQSLFDELEAVFPNIEFVQDFQQSVYNSLLPTERNLIIIDDLMSEAKNSSELSNLFTKGSHHRNATIILILQNLFARGTAVRTASLNSHYTALFKNPRDAGQIRTYAQQIDGKNRKFIEDAFKDATSVPYGYLVFDFRQTTSDNVRLRTNIFKDEETVIYGKPDLNNTEVIY